MHFDYTQCKQKGFALGLILVVVVILAVVAGGAYYVGKVVNTPPHIVPVITPNPQSGSTPDETATPDSIGANWKTYTNKRYGYSVKYPPTIVPDENAGGSYSVLFGIFRDGPGLPNFYVSVIPDGFWENGAIYNDPNPDFLTLLFSVPVGSTKSIYPDTEWETWSRLPDTKIENSVAQVYENKHPWEAQYDKRVFVIRAGFTYMIGSYNDDVTNGNFDQFLSTFKFLDQNKCGSCPQFMPANKDFCKDGTIIPGEKNECGCQRPPICQR